MTYNYLSPVSQNGDSLGPSLAEYCSASAFVTFATILNAFLLSKKDISRRNERVKSVEPDDNYDFVVIGGGAGGSVVASRLSEIPDWKVLLLETGPDQPAVSGVPMIYRSLMWSAHDWNYTTTNERYACLSRNGSCLLSAGQMLGGCTSQIPMLYFRGNPSDFDHWADLGNDGWSYEDVLPYFKKGEDNGEIERVGRKYHSTGGLLPVERLPYLHPFGYSILAAATEAGYKVEEDLNGAKTTGFTILQTTSKNGVGRSSAAAYLWPVKNRKNLHISLNSTGTKVIIENGKAVGVQYYKNGKFKTIRVHKEVIVTAGTIESPKLLLLSGIGPKKHLKSKRVEVVHDLPGVGENYHDHMGFRVPATVNETDTYEYDWAAAAEYLAFQTGPMSNYGLLTVVGKVATSLTTPDSPDITIGFDGYMTPCAPGEIDALRSSGRRAVNLLLVNLRPQSRGRITLLSNNPLDYPMIRGNYLSDRTDVDRVIEGIKLGQALIKSKAIRAHDMTISSDPIDACSEHIFGSTEYWTCAIRQNAASGFHYAGTCKMGNSSDSMAVVDPRLRVYGLKGLRVADASIMPQVTSSNTGAPVMMIGERAADFIKQDWGRYS